MFQLAVIFIASIAISLIARAQVIEEPVPEVEPVDVPVEVPVAEPGIMEGEPVVDPVEPDV